MPTQVARVGVSHRCCNFLDTECRVEEQTMGGFSPREVNSHPEARSAATAELSRQVARRHTALCATRLNERWESATFNSISRIALVTQYRSILHLQHHVRNR